MTPEEKLRLPPDRVTIDLVLKYSASGKVARNEFSVLANNTKIFLLAVNHQGDLAQVMIDFHLDGEPEDGPPARFVVYKIGPTACKLAPSLTVPGALHAFITFVDVPEPAPWERSSIGKKEDNDGVQG